ncbi:hypothetical protein LCGC14_1563700 [marine sediment metagenome]|uniref:Uncharacterized protein n=1 Tax=marine sediment metagenome TaxID=412755 RepID=A0A0F9J7X4_9ZZZZ
MTSQQETDVRSIERQLQRLGRLRQQRQALEAEENELTAAVRGRMSEHGITIVRSHDFQARLVRREQLNVDPAALQRRLSKKDFLACITVRVQEARKYLGNVALRRIGEVAESVQLRISPRAERATSSSESSEKQLADTQQ